MDDIDIELITRLMEGKSCAELETVINEGGIYAGFAGREKIAQEDFLKACLYMIYLKRSKLPDDEEESNFDSEHQREVAIHETGYVVVSEILDSGSVSAVTTASAGDGQSGLTILHNPDICVPTKDILEKNILCLLGGRVAVDMMLGHYDIKGESDYNDAAQLVDKLLGSDIGSYHLRKAKTSEDYIQKREQRIDLEMEKYTRQARNIIANNKDFYDAILEKLIDKKILTYRDLAEIKETL